MERWVAGYSDFMQGHATILLNLTEEFQLGGLGF
jgi:hypothetical protein